MTETANASSAADPAPLRSGPLSPTQELLWQIDRRLPGASPNISVAVRLTGELVPAALEEAFHRLVARHEPLRTRYREVEGEARAEVLPHRPFGWERHDFRGLEAAALATRLELLVAATCRRPFDLAAGRPVRSALCDLGERRWAWLLALHHIGVDGWGMAVVSRDLSALYRSLVRGEPCRLEELPAQCIDYAAAQRRWAEGPEAAEQLRWWVEHLTDPPAVPLALAPAERPAGAALLPTSLQVLALPPDLAARVAAARRRQRTSSFVLLLAAFMLLLSRWSGQEDVIVGTLVANRLSPESGGVLGAHYNTALLRCRLDGELTARELLERIGRACADLHERQAVPFDRVAAAAGARLGLAPERLLAAMFLHDEHPLRRLDLGGVAVADLDWSPGALADWLAPGAGEGSAAGAAAPAPKEAVHDLAASASDLTLYAREGPGSLDLYVFYKTGLFAGETIRWALDGFAAIVAGLVEQMEADAGVDSAV